MPAGRQGGACCKDCRAPALQLIGGHRASIGTPPPHTHTQPAHLPPWTLLLYRCTAAQGLLSRITGGGGASSSSSPSSSSSSLFGGAGQDDDDDDEEAPSGLYLYGCVCLVLHGDVRIDPIVSQVGDWPAPALPCRPASPLPPLLPSGASQYSARVSAWRGLFGPS